MPDALIWPAVAVICIIILGTLALFLLRPALLRLVDRTKKVGKDGLTFDRPQEGGKPETALLSFDELMKLPITASILDREKYLKTYIQTLNLKSDSEKIDVLIRMLSFSRLEVEFNNISYFIFGSQINLLIRLSGTSQGLSLPQAETIFNQAKDKFPTAHETRTLNDWLNYLITHNLITQTTEGINITQYGKDFLKHLVDTNQAYERYG
ncbi:MAG: hypothetical protein Q8M34_02555 [Thermodesulfovibrionales bacterium]|nr:hypothetical protein [Thermodesulfovibrionales bacterium]